MKTPTCYRKVTAVKNPNCPVCHPGLNVIARPLPYAYCANSKLICAHSGAAMNENNVPMMLPNGYVFSINVIYIKLTQLENIIKILIEESLFLKSLLQIMSENDGKVKCPRTNELYEFHETHKVFIL